jgi:hypothetical protein
LFKKFFGIEPTCYVSWSGRHDCKPSGVAEPKSTHEGQLGKYPGGGGFKNIQGENNVGDGLALRERLGRQAKVTQVHHIV